jgi:hypothetical protein
MDENEMMERECTAAAASLPAAIPLITGLFLFFFPPQMRTLTHYYCSQRYGSSNHNLPRLLAEENAK